MKNAKDYEKKIRKLLASAGKGKLATSGPDDEARLALLVRSVLEEDASAAAAKTVLDAIQKEFVDYNDLRVSPQKDLADVMGRGFPRSRMKAETICTALDRIFDKTGTMTLAYMDEMSKRDLRKHLGDVGLSPYAAASMVLLGFGGHAIPVDRSLVDVLEMEEMIHPGSDLPDVQGFLERVIPQKDALAAHEFLRGYVEAHADALAKLRAQRQAERLAQQQAQAEAERKQEEKKQARAAKAQAGAAKPAPKAKARSEAKSEAKSQPKSKPAAKPKAKPKAPAAKTAKTPKTTKAAKKARKK